MTKEDNKVSDSQIDAVDNQKNADESLDVQTVTKNPITKIPLHKLDMKRLIELDACTRCGEC